MNRFRNSLPKFKFVRPSNMSDTDHDSSEDEDPSVTLKKRLQQFDTKKKKKSDGHRRSHRGSLAHEARVKQRMDEIRWRARQGHAREDMQTLRPRKTLESADPQLNPTPRALTAPRPVNAIDKSLERMRSIHHIKFPAAKTFEEELKEIKAYNWFTPHEEDLSKKSESQTVKKAKNKSRSLQTSRPKVWQGNEKNKIVEIHSWDRGPLEGNKCLETQTSDSPAQPSTPQQVHFEIPKNQKPNMEATRVSINHILKEHAQHQGKECNKSMKQLAEKLHKALSAKPDKKLQEEQVTTSPVEKKEPDSNKSDEKREKIEAEVAGGQPGKGSSIKTIEPCPTVELERRLGRPPFKEPLKPEKQELLPRNSFDKPVIHVEFFEVKKTSPKVVDVDIKAARPALIKPQHLNFGLEKGLENLAVMPRKSATLCVVSPTATSSSTSVRLKKAKQELTFKDAGSLKDDIRAKSSRSAELRDLVNQTIKDHKIFCIFDNHWYIVRPVREELLKRGWMEVIPDRRLIPRRRPPPAGPSSTLPGMEKTLDHTTEALLKAKENLLDDVQEQISKSPIKKPWEREKNFVPSPAKKYSSDSLSEAVSEFRIVPPTNERKRNNVDIREFVTKRRTDKQPETEKDEKENKKSAPLSLHTLDAAKEISKGLNFQYQTPATYLQNTVSQNMDVSGRNSLTEDESKTVSRIIQASNARINFMWLSIKPGIHLKCFSYSPEMINKFQKTTFCTKIGLWNHLNNIQWYAHEVRHPAKSPRMYNTGEADDLQAFFQDFHMTACMGILKWLADTFYDKGIKAVQSKRGKVPIKAFEFAIRQCEKYVKFRENEDLRVAEEPKVLQEEWNAFLQWFYIITNDHGKVQESSNAQLLVVYTRAVEMLRIMKRHWPEIDIDGRLNIWIMKPYCASCGRGIFMTNNIYYIGQHNRYIVQKYIERPLLIYNTKFDIRQWFLVTRLTPLEIWMYKECYLRFCTQPFALKNLHESVHLSNNSVQRKYVGIRDPSLPDQNMWDSFTFQEYLKTVGYPDVWQEIIYPGMRDAIISTMLSSQDTFDSPRKNWFELYGADFMLSANVADGPWLIEINENPAMDPSTKVTARMCPQMLRDVIKVVVDKRASKNASTGQWELIYRQNYSPSYGSIDLDIKGKRIARVSKPSRGSSRKSPRQSVCDEQQCDQTYEVVSGLQNENANATYKQKIMKSKLADWKFAEIQKKIDLAKNSSNVNKREVKMAPNEQPGIDENTRCKAVQTEQKKTYIQMPTAIGSVNKKSQKTVEDSKLDHLACIATGKTASPIFRTKWSLGNKRYASFPAAVSGAHDQLLSDNKPDRVSQFNCNRPRSESGGLEKYKFMKFYKSRQ